MSPKNLIFILIALILNASVQASCSMLTELDDTSLVVKDTHKKTMPIEKNPRLAPYSSFYERLLKQSMHLSTKERDMLEDILILTDSALLISQRMKELGNLKENIARQPYGEISKIATRLALIKAYAVDRGISEILSFLNFLKEQDFEQGLFLTVYCRKLEKAVEAIATGTAKEKTLRRLLLDWNQWAYEIRSPHHSEARRYRLFMDIGTLKGHLYKLDKQSVLSAQPEEKKRKTARNQPSDDEW